MNAEFASSEIGQPTHLIKRFEIGAAGDNDFYDESA